MNQELEVLCKTNHIFIKMSYNNYCSEPLIHLHTTTRELPSNPLIYDTITTEFNHTIIYHIDLYRGTKEKQALDILKTYLKDITINNIIKNL